MALEITTLSQIKDMVATLPKPDGDAAEAARTRQNQLTKPPGSLGKLEEIAVFMASWCRSDDLV